MSLLLRLVSRATLRKLEAKEVRRIRQWLGLTQKQLAERMGVARNTVARWEMGTMQIREPAARLLKIISKEQVKK